MCIRDRRKRVGMVFQKPNPFPMSIYDNIAYGPRTHGIRSKAKLDDIVEKSLRNAAIWDECKDRLKKSALGMSGGQQQRLCIARALAVEPEVLLMDEPTSALDPISTSKIEDLAMELKKDYTIVMVTHNMQQAVRVSDNTAFFLLGEVVEYNDTEKLFSIPSDKMCIRDRFQHVHRYNPIEHIKTRIKSAESIVKKLKRYGYETSIENMVRYVNDIAGVRLICSFTSDIYRLAEMIGNQSDLKVLSIKDYIKNPKESGYKSYHMLVSVPIFLSDSVVDTKVEIQIRTIAMDFWASLEHKIYYKFEGQAPEYISRELKECADMVSALDRCV